MSERSDRPAAPLRLVLDFGESVELDGSTVYDPTAGAAVPAVVLRMPPHRAAWFSRVLDAYTQMCRVADELPAAESGPAWALARVSSAAGYVAPSAVELRRVSSARRMSAAAVLRSAGDLDDVTMVAVVDAAARWLDEPDGDEYAYALLGAVVDGPTQLRAYGELLGTAGGTP
jgi:hypothetical protein